jgi:hypothetical protein
MQEKNTSFCVIVLFSNALIFVSVFNLVYFFGRNVHMENFSLYISKKYFTNIIHTKM